MKKPQYPSIEELTEDIDTYRSILRDGIKVSSYSSLPKGSHEQTLQNMALSRLEKPAKEHLQFLLDESLKLLAELSSDRLSSLHLSASYPTHKVPLYEIASPDGKWSEEGRMRFELAVEESSTPAR